MSPVQFDSHNRRYVVSASISRSDRGSLVDRGANGGIIGNDAKVYAQHQRQVDVTGIDSHELNSLKIVDASAKVLTQKGYVIAIMRQYAYHGTGRSIHSSGQLEHYNNKVDDRSMRVKGRQCITTLDGYIIPLDIINGLPYMKMCPNTDAEWEELPHVILTSGDEWDPSVLDHVLTDQEDWYDTLKEWDDDLLVTPFDQFGNYRGRTVLANEEPEPPIEVNTVDAFRVSYDAASTLNRVYLCYDAEGEVNSIDDDANDTRTIPPKSSPTRTVTTKPPNYEQFRPYFLHVPIDKIRKTFQMTTQHAVNVMSGHVITQTLKSPFPAHNVWRRNEPVASDTIYAEVPAVDTGGMKMAQLFIGRKSLVIDVYGMSNENEFVNALEDQIRKRGAMDKLITDSARVEILRRVKDILRALCIDDWQSEPEYQHQNFAELRWKFLKRNGQWVMNYRNVAPNAWLLCLQWVADVMNHTSERSLGGRPPLQVLTGQTIDISILLLFIFWDIVYCARYDDASYSGQIGSTKSSEIRGRFVGFAWNVGHALTFKVLTDDTQKVICRSRLRLAGQGENNLKLNTDAGAVPQRIYFCSKRDSDSDSEFRLPTIDIATNPFSVEQLSEKGEPSDSDRGEDDADDDDMSLPELVSRDSEPDDPDDSDSDSDDDDDDSDFEPTSVTSDDELDDEFEDEDRSPMDDPPLHSSPQVRFDPQDVQQDFAPEVRDKRKPGDPNPDQVPLDFTFETLRTENPTMQVQLPPDELIDRTFLMPTQEDGSRVRAKIIERVNKYKEGVNDDPELIKFKCLVNDDYQEIVAYNDIVDFIEQDQSWDGIWKFKEILDHQGPLKSTDKGYKGSRYNVLVLWETGEKSWEPLTRKDKTGVFDTDPATVAIYARQHGLLDTPGWKMPALRAHAKTQQRVIRRANQAKLHSFRTKPIYMFGILVPRNHQQAMEIDKANGDTKWRDAELKELGQINEYDTFLDKGIGYIPGPGYKKIKVHMIFAAKHTGILKARLVAGGHLTDTPIDSVYSSVVSLRGIRMLTFIGELNELEVWCTDVGNAYLESFTKEKVYIIAGPEFGDLEGHTLIIQKALYGLRSSGLRFHERLADVLRDMGFIPSRAEPDIWMIDKGDHYEYIAVYVDDLLVVSRDPGSLIDVLLKKYKFKLKGTGPISYHLGCDFFRDDDGNLCYAPRKYIEKMLANYQRIFGQMPRQVLSPLIKGDHPELDKTELLDVAQVQIYQSLIGALQWTIQIGRFDVATAVMTMSRFRAAPRQGHLDRVKRIHGYLSKMRHGVVRIRTELPDYSDLPQKIHEWDYTCYHGATEEIPKNLPRPLGKRVVTTHYFDANLYHDLISGRSVTGILHLFNKTPIDWYSKLQATVETATFGSEYVAARTCTEQIIDLRNTLRYLGVPINGPSYVFGDNESVINTASLPHGKLNKRHNALSYHRTREAVAAGIIRLYYIPGSDNPADILSKHWDYNSVWSQLQPLLFWKGDTAKLIKAESEQEENDDA